MSQLISSFPLPIFSIISTAISMGLFVGIIFYAFFIKSKEELDEAANLPLQDDHSISNTGV